MKKILTLLTALMLICAPGFLCAQETGWINVVRVGGQTTNMFIDVSVVVGEPGCRGNRIIVSQGTLDADSQKRFYAALLTAMATGTRVALAVSGCSGNYPIMIATDYWFVQNS